MWGWWGKECIIQQQGEWSWVDLVSLIRLLKNNRQQIFSLFVSDRINRVCVALSWAKWHVLYLQGIITTYLETPDNERNPGEQILNYLMKHKDDLELVASVEVDEESKVENERGDKMSGGNVDNWCELYKIVPLEHI